MVVLDGYGLAALPIPIWWTAPVWLNGDRLSTGGFTHAVNATTRRPLASPLTRNPRRDGICRTASSNRHYLSLRGGAACSRIAPPFPAMRQPKAWFRYPAETGQHPPGSTDESGAVLIPSSAFGLREQVQGCGCFGDFGL